MLNKSFVLIFSILFLGAFSGGAIAKEAAEKPSKTALPSAISEEAPADVTAAAGKAAEDVKAASSSLTEAADALAGAAKEGGWEAYPPAVAVTKWGSELRIIVTPNPAMGDEKTKAIQSVKMETEEGEFLGLKTYTPTETTRVAEFMVNPEILKIETVKLTVNSTGDGDWVHVQSLEVKEEAPKEALTVEPSSDNIKETTSETPKEAVAVPEKAQEKGKKKGMFW